MEAALQSKDLARSSVLRLEQHLNQLEQVDLPLRHFFIKGCYVREMFIPAGTVLTGKIHKHEHVFILVSGELSVFSEFGQDRIQAPYITVSPAGIKRAGYAHTDCLCLNVLRTDETEVAEAERDLVVDTYEEYQCFLNSLPAPSVE